MPDDETAEVAALLNATRGKIQGLQSELLEDREEEAAKNFPGGFLPPDDSAGSAAIRLPSEPPVRTPLILPDSLDTPRTV